MNRIVLVVLIAWIAIGLVVWLSGSDEETAEPTLEAAADTELGEPTGTPRALESSADAPTAPGLERTTQGGESATALMKRIGRTIGPAERAEIRAWVRAHPDRMLEWMRALIALRLNYAQLGWRTFFGDILGPLHDLEPQLSPGLIESLELPLPNRNMGSPPAIGALEALLPLGESTRRSLEAWARAHVDSRNVTSIVVLVTESAQSGEELLPLVQWVLVPDKTGKHPVYLQSVMRSIEGLGPRGAGLAQGLAEYAMGQRAAGRAIAKAMIAIGPEDPAVQRALAAMLTGLGREQDNAMAFFNNRDDGKAILLAALRDDSLRVRLGAVLLLMRNRWADHEVLLPPLLTCLTAPELLWRDRAMRLVPHMAQTAEQVVPTLEAMFLSHDEYQWVTAAKTLHLLASAYDDRFDVTAALEDALRHDNVRVRRVVVQGLMNYGADAAVPMLVKALEDRDALVRERACDGLGELAQKHAGALAALKEASLHSDERVVAMAKAWLEEIEDLAGNTAGPAPDGK